MSVMTLRALTLLAVLGLSSTAGAAEGLLHLCRGSVRLTHKCCCGPKAHKKQPSDRHLTASKQAACCVELDTSRAPSPPVTAAASQVAPVPPLAVEPPQAPRLPPAPEQPPSAWALARGVHHATAPPLYLRLCSYLL